MRVDVIPYAGVEFWVQGEGFLRCLFAGFGDGLNRLLVVYRFLKHHT